MGTEVSAMGTEVLLKSTTPLVVLAIVCLAYGIFVGLTTVGSRFYVSWIVTAVGLGAFEVLVYVGAWDAVPGWARSLFVGVVACAGAVFVATELLVVRGFLFRERKGLDYIIVLGAHIIDNYPSKALRLRLERAARYLEENPDTVCIVSGGQGSDERYTEALVMKQVLVELGVAEARIVMEDRSTDTIDNIRFSMRIMDEAERAEDGLRVGIVTNNFHLCRAMCIARRCGLVEPCGIVAPATWAYLPNNMFREFFGFVKFWLGGFGR